MKATKFLAVFLALFGVSAPTLFAFPFADSKNPLPGGYQGTIWGSRLGDFRASKRSKTTYSVEKLNARALDYLLMNFHEVDKYDPARAP